MRFSVAILAALIVAMQSSVESYKILAVFPMPAHSHYTLTQKILKELARKGHELVVISPYPQKTPIENFHDISVASLSDVINERKKHLYELENQGVFHSVRFLMNMGYILTEKCLEHEAVQKLLQSNEQFDLILMPQFVNDAHMGFIHKFRAPVIQITSMQPFTWGTFLLSHPSSSSYVQNVFTDFTAEMTFLQRFLNTFYDTYAILYHQMVMLPKHRELVRKYIPGSPDLYDFMHNVSLLLVNTHASIYDATPQAPNVVEIGGIHVDPPKKLSRDLQEFLDNSTNGVVVFSMGSNLKSSDLSPQKLEGLLEAFRKLKQNVLWKWETDELPGKPPNVKVMKWLPQQDVLAHPNVSVFMSHGGLLSTIESIYHGVPVVGIPIFADQKTNIATAAAYGFAVTVPFGELNEEKLSYALNEVLNNPKYRENVMVRSRIMKDRPIPPLDNAIYWIEYVVRHQGAPHLRYAGSKLTWYQRNLLDVIMTALLVIIGTITLSVILLKRLLMKKQTLKPKSKSS